MEDLTYEEAMGRLEKLVSRMENNELNLDQLGDALKEAQALVKHCRGKLHQTDEQVKKALNDGLTL